LTLRRIPLDAINVEHYLRALEYRHEIIGWYGAG